MRHNRLDPRMVKIMSLLDEATALIESGRTADGLERLRQAEMLMADLMDIDIDDWRDQAEFLP